MINIYYYNKIYTNLKNIQDHKMCMDMPKQVEFKNLVSNILNSRDIEKKNIEDYDNTSS